MSATTIEEAIKYILINDNGVKAITTRCFPVTLPQNPEFPLILYMRITGIPDNLLKGVSGLTYSRFQIEAWAETYAEAKDLSKAIRDTLNAKTFTVDSVLIGSIVAQNEHDVYEDVVACHRIIQDFTLWHT